MANAAEDTAGIPIPGEGLPAEGGEGQETTQSEVKDDYAEEAGAKGWRPQEEYEGPKGSWVSAEEFLKREPLFDKIKNQSKELKGLKKTVEAMTSQFQTQVKAQVELRLRELKAAKREAVEAGDVDQVDRLDAEIDQQKQTVTETVPQVPEEVSDWIDQNPWFKDDKELNAWAITHNKTYVANNPGDVSGSLKATELAVKKAFPEKFEKPKPKTPANPVEGNAGPKDVGGKNNFTVSRLSEEQRQVYNQLVTRHKTLSHEEYFKGLAEIGELK